MGFRHWAGVFATAAVLSAASSGLASAHVGVSAPDAAPGGFTVLTVRVPTESVTAGTVKLEITLPKDTPLATVRTAPVPGWQAEQKRSTLPKPVDDGHGHTVSEYVSSVVFTARDGSAIAPGEFGEFKLQVGPLPHVSELVFPAIQTYSDGTVVSWIERSADGTTPDKPAPVLKLSGSHGDDHIQDAAETKTPGSKNDSAVSGWLAGTALVLSLAALALAGAPWLRRVRNE
ncbi:YcnI family protein [Nocardia jejuensis]|uniref:YcnI family protein n=1 Tax=Nocardia jejuensis TaxID=328049 RepID=UPI000831DCA6|nr:YcnI family protein [Nocardia jejuensis]